MNNNSKEVTVSGDQIAAACFLTCFITVVDKMIEDSGHEALLVKIPTDKMMNVFAMFGNTNSVKEVFKLLKKEVPDIFPSANIIKLLYLRMPFYYGMVLAHKYFGNTETIDKEVR